MKNTKMKRAIQDSLASGSYWFTKETTEFWNSKVEYGMLDNDTFVTSEDNYNRTKTLYTVRKYDWDKHNVDTVSGFQQFDNLTDAIRFAEEYEEED